MINEGHRPIRYSSSIDTATKVLEEIQKIGTTIPESDIVVAPYAEQGLAIKVFNGSPGNPFCVSFSKLNTSDDIVVHSGQAAEEAQFFPVGRHLQAARYILKTIERYYYGDRTHP